MEREGREGGREGGKGSKGGRKQGRNPKCGTRAAEDRSWDEWCWKRMVGYVNAMGSGGIWEDKAERGWDA